METLVTQHAVLIASAKTVYVMEHVFMGVGTVGKAKNVCPEALSWTRVLLVCCG